MPGSPVLCGHIQEGSRTRIRAVRRVGAQLLEDLRGNGRSALLGHEQTGPSASCRIFMHRRALGECPVLPRRVHDRSADDRGPVCSISPAMASGSHECQFRRCDSMTHGNGLSLALFSWGVVFDLKRRPATPPSRVTASARRHAGCARTRRPMRRRPGGSDGGPAPGHRQSAHPFGQILVVGGGAQCRCPSSGRTPPDGAVDRR
jgi:hypothetical protein